MTKYYKVLSHNLTSIGHLPKEYIIQYKVDKWVKPNIKHTKLILFSSLKFAKDFLEPEIVTQYQLQLYQVETKNPTQDGPYVPCINGCPHDMFRTLMHEILAKKLSVNRFKMCDLGLSPDDISFLSVSPGTIFADAVKLIRCVG